MDFIDMSDGEMDFRISNSKKTGRFTSRTHQVSTVAIQKGTVYELSFIL